MFHKTQSKPKQYIVMFGELGSAEKMFQEATSKKYNSLNIGKKTYEIKKGLSEYQFINFTVKDISPDMVQEIKRATSFVVFKKINELEILPKELEHLRFKKPVCFYNTDEKFETDKNRLIEFLQSIQESKRTLRRENRSINYAMKDFEELQVSEDPAAEPLKGLAKPTTRK